MCIGNKANFPGLCRSICMFIRKSTHVARIHVYSGVHICTHAGTYGCNSHNSQVAIARCICLSKCVFIFDSSFMFLCVRTLAYTLYSCTLVHMHIYRYEYMCICTHVYKYIYRYIHICIRVYVYTYVSIYIFICVYTYMFIYMYI